MLNAIDKLFSDIDYFAECASKVQIEKYSDIIRSKCIYSRDTERGAFFCAIPKSCCDSPEKAVPILFIYSLYDAQEWPKTEESWSEDFTIKDWKRYLKTIWIPDCFSCKGASRIPYTQSDIIKGPTLKDELLKIAVLSPVLSIIRCGTIDEGYFFTYVIETEDEYIFFETW